MRFDELKLIEPLLRAVHGEGYTEPTPIQVQAIPHVLLGHDLLGCAQTGTGKTAAFALPILQRLSAAPRTDRSIRVLVLAPTRELATQINDSFRAYGKHTGQKSTVIFGGVGQNPQIEAVKRGVDILVATPGRLLDLMGQGYIKLDRIEVLVLDEADRMLDMGFIHDVRRIIAAVPRQRQTLLFSATMPPEIQELANNILNNPEYVAVTPVASTVETIQQSVYFVEKRDKPALLEHILRDKSISRVLIFTRTKHGANKVVKQLAGARIHGEAIHGNKSQTARERALANFKNGSIRVLVATDIAARGIDVDNITHVVNYDLPNEPETYVHRIGRTARAGASGYAISFCDTEEREYLRDIERLIQLHIPRATDYPYASPLPPPPMTDLTRRAGGSRPQPQSRPSSSNGSHQGQGSRQGGQNRSNSGARTERPTGQSGQNSPQASSRSEQRPTGQTAAPTDEGQGSGKRRRSRRRRRPGQTAPREVAN
jgi:ATP-dependent RNA helicase RhlE